MSGTFVENRATLLTGAGTAAIAVVRITGPGVLPFLHWHFSRATKIARCVHGDLTDGARVIDDPVIVLISDTAADINIHGGTWVIRSTLDLIQSNGFQLQEYAAEIAALDIPEGSSVIWQEVIQAIPQARTEQAVRMLLAQPDVWEKLLLQICGKIISAEEIHAIEQDRSLQWMLSLPRVAIIGPPNVGKSTLANRLFGQERSITADVPGTTRDWVGEIANIDGLAVTLIDTAGRRVTDDPIEAAAIAAGAEQMTAADLVVIVLDQSAPLDSGGRELVESFPGAICIANKSDRPSAWNIGEMNAIATAAITNVGIKELRLKIRQHFGCGEMDAVRPYCWTARQRVFLPTQSVR